MMARAVHTLMDQMKQLRGEDRFLLGMLYLHFYLPDSGN